MGDRRVTRTAKFRFEWLIAGQTVIGVFAHEGCACERFHYRARNGSAAHTDEVVMTKRRVMLMAIAGLAFAGFGGRGVAAGELEAGTFDVSAATAGANACRTNSSQCFSSGHVGRTTDGLGATDCRAQRASRYAAAREQFDLCMAEQLEVAGDLCTAANPDWVRVETWTEEVCRSSLVFCSDDRTGTWCGFTAGRGSVCETQQRERTTYDDEWFECREATMTPAEAPAAGLRAVCDAVYVAAVKQAFAEERSCRGGLRP